jgi:hypothetical protein
MKHQKQVIRRTFSQERFEILIKKQKRGNATFNELTELDEIVNRDPGIRYIVLEEMEGTDTPESNQKQQDIIKARPLARLNLFEKIKLLINKLFNYVLTGAAITHLVY